MTIAEAESRVLGSTGDQDITGDELASTCHWRKSLRPIRGAGERRCKLLLRSGYPGVPNGQHIKLDQYGRQINRIRQ